MKGESCCWGSPGGIAAYKAAALGSHLVQAGAGVTVVMTGRPRNWSAPKPSRP